VTRAEIADELRALTLKIDDSEMYSSEQLLLLHELAQMVSEDGHLTEILAALRTEPDEAAVKRAAKELHRSGHLGRLPWSLLGPAQRNYLRQTARAALRAAAGDGA
jgi:fatty acid-binding protein DegV